MKKIVGILAAAAIFATSVFAADVSAGVRIEGSLFDYKANGDIAALTFKHKNEDYHKPVSFSISDDKAGATFHFTDQEGTTMTSTKWSIWFKPLDVLKITVGDWDANINVETIDYNTYSKIGSAGYTLSLTPVDGLSFDLTFAPGWQGKSWLSKANGADAVVDELGLKIAYSADFGTIGAIFDAKKTFEEIKFGAGYKNTFDSLTMFVTFLGWYVKPEFAKIRAEAYAEYAADAIKFQAFVAGGYNMIGFDPLNTWDFAYCDAAKKAFVGAKMKFSYSMDAGTFYVYVKDENFLADAFAMQIKPGFAYNVGCMSGDIAVQFDIANKVAVSVPVSFAVSF
jgi:hypothetical protein